MDERKTFEDAFFGINFERDQHGYYADQRVRGWWEGWQCRADIVAALASSPSQPADIKAMVDRFLAWPLPKSFAPDCGISFKRNNHPNSWPIGTNLFTADEARQMLEHVLAAAPAKVEGK